MRFNHGSLSCCFSKLFLTCFLRFEACYDMVQAAMRAGSAAWEVALKAISSSSTPDRHWSGVAESLWQTWRAEDSEMNLFFSGLPRLFNVEEIPSRWRLEANMIPEWALMGLMFCLQSYLQHDFMINYWILTNEGLLFWLVDVVSQPICFVF